MLPGISILRQPLWALPLKVDAGGIEQHQVEVQGEEVSVASEQCSLDALPPALDNPEFGRDDVAARTQAGVGRPC